MQTPAGAPIAGGEAMVAGRCVMQPLGDFRPGFASTLNEGHGIRWPCLIFKFPRGRVQRARMPSKTRSVIRRLVSSGVKACGGSGFHPRQDRADEHLRSSAPS